MRSLRVRRAVCAVLLLAASGAASFLLGPTAAPISRLQAPRSTAYVCEADYDVYRDIANYEWWEDGLTCVEFEVGDEVHLGVYRSYSMLVDSPHIVPLCSSSEEDGVGALLCDEESPHAPLSAVRRILDPDYVFVSERQAGGGQGLGNPHGEHGEECFDLREVGVSEAVSVIVREGRDTERVL